MVGTVDDELIELRCATRAMVGRAKAVEDAPRRRAPQTRVEPGAAGLCGDLRRLREMAQGVAAAVARLTADLDL